MSAKEDAISELKSIQRKQENSIKEIERLKEQNKRRTKQTIGGMSTDNPVQYGVGKGLMSRFNLGGGGAGLRTTAMGDQLGASKNFGEGGIGNTYRSNLGGADKSTEFKSAFTSQFGARLGLGGAGAGAQSGVSESKLGGFGLGAGIRDSQQSISGMSQGGLQTFGNQQPQSQGSVPSLGAAMNQMQNNQNEKNRTSNLLSTPSDRPNMEEENN